MSPNGSYIAARVLAEVREEFARAQDQAGQDFATFAKLRVLARSENLPQLQDCILPTRHAFKFADGSVLTLADGSGDCHMDDSQLFRDGRGHIVGIWDNSLEQMHQYLDAIRASDAVNAVKPVKPPGKTYAELRDELGEGMSLFVQPDGTVIPIPRTAEGLEEAIRHSMSESELMVQQLGVDPADLDAELASHYELLRNVHQIYVEKESEQRLDPQ